VYSLTFADPSDVSGDVLTADLVVANHSLLAAAASYKLTTISFDQGGMYSIQILSTVAAGIPEARAWLMLGVIGFGAVALTAVRASRARAAHFRSFNR
jgi:hypothetical protein